MKVVIGQGSCGIATGAKKTESEFLEQIKKHNVDVDLTVTGCVGTCYLEPIVDVYDNDGKMTRYVKVQPDKVEKIVEEHLKGGQVVSDYAIDVEDQQFLAKQERRPDEVNELLESLTRQSITDFEVIVVEDGIHMKYLIYYLNRY